ncbi:MAG TPA: VOC family protein [Bryobacteraceae bacterium]|nr:VOC family protein [Bryobacteraceae bacterium]
MAHVDQHAPGAFSWIELATSDQTAAKHFYTALFGWTSTDSPMGPNEFYTMFQLYDRNVGAAYTMRADEASHGIPPHWNLYITVASADEATAKAVALGGSVLAGPFDVMTYGRMSVIADPTGAVFCTWEPKDHAGLGVISEAGALCWADLSTPDQAAAATFYKGLFGYAMPPGEGGYLHLQNGEDFIGGIQPPEHRAPHAPPHWLIYFQVADCDHSTDRAKQLGANVYMAPMTMENIGRFAVMADPQGAVFALFQPDMRR